MLKLLSSPPLRFLGSMPVAITALSALAIASTIGTILQQNQPYQDYLIKFGPFWHRFYETLGLYDVYSAGWFLLVLAFLVGSTSLCLIHNAPGILKGAHDFRTRMQGGVLAHMPETDEWHSPQPRTALAEPMTALLQSRGYRLRQQADNDRLLLAAKRGSANRYGYVFTHLAVVVICIGGLVDGNLPMKLNHLRGDLQIETRDLRAVDIPAASRVAAGSTSFRANINIPEGAAANFAFINLGPGYVLQELPFQIRLKEFRIEHYSSGQPKAFESDLILHDPERDVTIEQTIGVNHPLRYRGYNIYQASFEDGGSRLQLTAHPLRNPAMAPLDIDARVSEAVAVTMPDGELLLELDDFRLHNINRESASVDKVSGREFRDSGPSYTYKLRQPDGIAREYENYMFPLTVNDREYFLSGMRESTAEQFRYLYLPADSDGSPRQFLELLKLLHDDERLDTLLAAHAETTANRLDATDADAAARIRQAMLDILILFRDGGFAAIIDRIDTTVPAAEREFASQAYIRLLHNSLQVVYLALINATAGVENSTLDATQTAFVDDAMQAIAGLGGYGAPFFLELNDFEHRQASGLLVARSPGKMMVYPGFLLLLAGVFLLFYMAERRIWLELTDSGNGTRLRLAGESNRLQEEFASEFRQIAAAARQLNR